MAKNIELKNAPLRRLPVGYHINIMAKGGIIIRLVNRGICIAFNVIVNAYFFGASNFFNVWPVPFGKRRPLF